MLTHHTLHVFSALQIVTADKRHPHDLWFPVVMVTHHTLHVFSALQIVTADKRNPHDLWFPLDWDLETESWLDSKICVRWQTIIKGK